MSGYITLKYDYRSFNNDRKAEAAWSVEKIILETRYKGIILNLDLMLNKSLSTPTTRPSDISLFRRDTGFPFALNLDNKGEPKPYETEEEEDMKGHFIFIP